MRKETGKEVAVVVFNNRVLGETFDLEVPLDISANELFEALNIAFNFGVDKNDMKKYHFSCERPIALLRGEKELKEFGVRNGTVINYFG